MILDNFKITWGIHKELLQLFTKDNRDYFALFTYDVELTENALKIALSDRDQQGKITKAVNLEDYDLKDLELICAEIDQYFTEFFFRQKTRLAQLQEKSQM